MFILSSSNCKENLKAQPFQHSFQKMITFILGEKFEAYFPASLQNVEHGKKLCEIINARLPKPAPSSFTFPSVVSIFWARDSCSLTLADACFRLGITLEVALVRFLVCVICVPGSLRSGSRVALS